MDSTTDMIMKKEINIFMEGKKLAKHYSIIQYGLHHRHNNEKRDKYFYGRKETSGSRVEEREKQIPSKNENLRIKNTPPYMCLQ